MENANDSAAVSTETTEEKGGGSEENTPQFVTKDDLGAALKEALEPITSDIGSLKRTAKKTTKETKTDTPEKTAKTDSPDLQKTVDELTLDIAGIKEQDEIDLYNRLKEETGKNGKDLLNSKYFQAELEGLRTDRSNADAASNVSGDKTKVAAKDSPEYWLAKGQPPTPEQVPDRKKRAEIARAFIGKGKTNGKTFYND